MANPLALTTRMSKLITQVAFWIRHLCSLCSCKDNHNFDQVLLKICNARDRVLLYFYDLKTKFKLNNKPCAARQIARQPKIHFFYISCGKDFDYLFISLMSLEKLNLACRGTVYLYIDKKDPLSHEHLKKLKEEFIWNMVIRETQYKLSWGGAKLLISELAAFREIVTQINQNDYVAKIDSDVLFISDRIFKEVINGDSEAIGQRKEEGFMEGGSYFLKASLISKIVILPINHVVNQTNRMDGARIWGHQVSKCPEDRTISILVRQSGGKMVLSDFRAEFTKRGFIENDLERCSIIHFSEWCGLRKEDMAEVWRSLHAEENVL